MTTRCKIHHGGGGGGGGVCAPCLRERLLALSAAQNEASPGHHRDPLGPLPPLDPSPLALPRSVSPYVPRRRSDAPRRNPSFLFFRSPQVGPSGVGDDGGLWIGEREKSGKGIGGVKFSILSTLFGHSGSSAESTSKLSRSRSKSWLSALVHVARRKKPPETGSPAPGRARRSLPVRDRGMSPEEEEEDDDCGDGESGCSRESPWLHPTPSPMRRGPRHRRGGVGGGGGVSGFAVCLSPLMRPSPGGRRRSRRSRAADLDFSGDLRCSATSQPPRCHGGADALGHCRSRKLGEFGRFR
ncbi:uncharacterized protein LOC109714937 [Ananas comosus]|uniref:Uncharacterized protein LOC109714937 n=1 Tax=Ananas comosus TaxID=4615 RepID=A0A199UHZ0_ANACO|nr:uncharacterized protein LOC109714937 [Ananas comosus]OAY64354.1 hypothetical protein ACMD2_27344 [Ananas comosus]